MTGQQTDPVTTDTTAPPVSTGNPPVTQPVMSPPSGPQPSPPVAGLNPETHSPDGKMWRDLYNGLTGGIQSLRNEKARSEGALNETISSLQRQLQERDGMVASLNTRISGLEGQLGEIQTLQETITGLQTQANLAGKYKILAEFPEVLKIQVKETLPPPQEGLDPIETMVNPIINLVENTTLEGEALRREIKRLETYYTTLQSLPGEPKTMPVAPAPPAPAGPAGVQDRSYWFNRALTLQDKMIANPDDTNLANEYYEAWAKVSELDKQGS